MPGVVREHLSEIQKGGTQSEEFPDFTSGANEEKSPLILHQGLMKRRVPRFYIGG